jgi:hypothetical protein
MFIELGARFRPHRFRGSAAKVRRTSGNDLPHAATGRRQRRSIASTRETRFGQDDIRSLEVPTSRGRP